ncbi:MAG: Ig-like domain-containing protein, partial [Dysgonamonadaceae bacterium]
MKTKFLKYSLVLLLLIGFIGCNEYVRTEVDKNIYVNHTSLNPFVGEQIQLQASPTDGTYKFSWMSEHPEVATVDNNGLVNVIAEGFTNIIVRDGDIETKVPLTALTRVPLTDVVLSETDIVSFINVNKTILVTYIPQQANDIPEYTWYSENENIATVNAIGKITFVGEGSTNI